MPEPNAAFAPTLNIPCCTSKTPAIPELAPVSRSVPAPVLVILRSAPKVKLLAAERVSDEPAAMSHVASLATVAVVLKV